MDQSLVAYFDERFRASSREIIEQVVQQIQSLREETLRRFEQVDARFEQVDARFEKVDRQFGEARETARLTLVLVEDVRHQIQQVAEGYRGCDDKLARIEGDREHYVRSIHMDDPVKDLDNRVGILEGWVDRHREVVGESIRRLAAGNPPPPLPTK